MRNDSIEAKEGYVWALRIEGNRGVLFRIFDNEKAAEAEAQLLLASSRVSALMVAIQLPQLFALQD